MSHLYILENKIPVPVEDTETWGQWFEKANRRVALTEVSDKQVSTVFLGIDHQWEIGAQRLRGKLPPQSLLEKPLLFETMVFVGDSSVDKYCMRYPNWDEAEAGHYAVVALIRVESDRA